MEGRNAWARETDVLAIESERRERGIAPKHSGQRLPGKKVESKPMGSDGDGDDDDDVDD